MKARREPVTDLVGRARAGDLGAWSELVAEFQDVAAALVAGWSGNWAIAEDVAQDAFVSAFIHLDELRDPQAFPAWFKQIAYSAMTHYFRREQRVPAAPPAGNEAGPDPGDAVVAHDEAEQLHHAVESLPEHERTVITLHYLADLPYAIVAEHLGISVSAAKKRGLSARRHLKELLPMAADAFSSVRPSRNRQLQDTVVLFLAIRRRDHDTVRALLAQRPQLVSATESWSQEDAMQLGLNNAEGGTPLVRAVQTGDVRLVDLVIEAGASPGQPCGCAGAESALWAAAHFGYTKIAARLLAAGASPDAVAFGGVTPLIVAAQRGHHEIADLLLEAGADPGIADAGGRTAHDWSARRGRGSPLHRPDAVLATGVRALDLFAPIRRGSTQWWPAAWELGQFALLTELVRAIEPREFWQVGFSTSPYDEESGRQWMQQFPVATELRLTRNVTPAERRAHFESSVSTVSDSRADKIVMVLTAPGHQHDVTVAIARLAADPTVLTTIVIEPATSDAAGARSDVPEGFDAQVAFDPWRALRGLWPAVDALRTSSTDYPSPRHARLAASARGVVERYRGIDPELEMQSPAIYPDPALARHAQDLHRYLAQPFVLWEHRTSQPGESTPYDELLDHVERLLSADVYHN